jgi:hypothetical protein
MILTLKGTSRKVNQLVVALLITTTRQVHRTIITTSNPEHSIEEAAAAAAAAAFPRWHLVVRSVPRAPLSKRGIILKYVLL